MWVRFLNRRQAPLRGVGFLCIPADLLFPRSFFGGGGVFAKWWVFSLMRGHQFAKVEGWLLETGPLDGLCARECIVLDESNRVLHAELVSEIANEPNYEAALKALA